MWLAAGNTEELNRVRAEIRRLTAAYNLITKAAGVPSRMERTEAVMPAGLTNGSESSIIEAPVNAVGSASPRNPHVLNPETDEWFVFVKGRSPEVPKDHTMAGFKCPTGRQIDDIDRLVKTYNAPAEGWQKEKARYWVYDPSGEQRQVELHWYQHEDVGKVEFKVKLKDNGGVYVDD